MEENTATLKEETAQLANMLRVRVEKGPEAWSQLHGKLAEVAAAALDNQRAAVQVLLTILKDEAKETCSSLSAEPDGKSFMRTLQERVSKANPNMLKDLVLRVADELKMTPLGDSEPVQMVDEYGNFCEENVDQIVKCSAELSAPNAPYAVISIVGAQSSGKSYLLNRLFGTRFPEMDAKLGRSRTTRGIMMSRCIGPSLLLLDVEGFVGRERGKDTIFQKHAAYFALNVSDLLMVNMSVFDIGREQGGATYIFRTIFEERTKLHSTSVTKILVVLRFYDGETPLEILRSDVMRSLEKIWGSVNEESAKLKDYIEVNIVGLPNKNSPDFPREVTVLRKMLSNNRSAKVPAHGFLLSSSIFWDTIKKRMELDIQQVAATRMYCRLIIEDALNSLDCQEQYMLLKAEESPSQFNEISHELTGKLKTEYDLETKIYDPYVRDMERQYLIERLHKIFTYDSRELIWKVQENTLEKFKGEFDRKTQNMKVVDLYGEQIVDEWIKKFMSSFEDLKVFDSEYLCMICGELKKKMQSYTALHTVAINVAVSRLYCREVAEVTVLSLDSQEIYKLLKEEESPRRFREISQELLEEIKSEYDIKTKMYGPDVREKEREYLVERLQKIFTYDSRELILKAKEHTSENFKRVFYTDIQNMKEVDHELYGEQIANKCIEEFMNSCEDLKIFDLDYIQRMCEDLRKIMESYIALLIAAPKEEHAGKADKKNKNRVTKVFTFPLGWPTWLTSTNGH